MDPVLRMRFFAMARGAHFDIARSIIKDHYSYELKKSYSKLLRNTFRNSKIYMASHIYEWAIQAIFGKEMNGTFGNKGFVASLLDFQSVLLL